jgi:hypothetical protein
MTTQDVLDAYNAAWGEPDVAARRGLLEKAWADDGVYTDPMTIAAGREALIDWISVMHDQFLGGVESSRPVRSRSTTVLCTSRGTSR